MFINNSKKIPIAVAVTVILFLILLLIYWKPPQEPSQNVLILDRKPIPITPELAEFMKKYPILTLTNGIAQTKIVGPDGLQITPCGQVKGTAITGECRLQNLNFDNFNSIQVLAPKEEGRCTIEQIGRYLIQFPSGRGKGNCKSQSPRTDLATGPRVDAAIAASKSSPISEPPPTPSTQDDYDVPELILDKVPVPISSELAKFLEEEGYVTLTFINAQSQVKIVDVTGAQIDPCGQVDGTEISGECDIDDFNLDPINEVTLSSSSNCPRCWTGKYLGSSVNFHARGVHKKKCPCNFPLNQNTGKRRHRASVDNCSDKDSLEIDLPLPEGCDLDDPLLLVRVGPYLLQRQIVVTNH